MIGSNESMRDVIDLHAGRIQRWAAAEFESLRRSIGQLTRADHLRRKLSPVRRKPAEVLP